MAVPDWDTQYKEAPMLRVVVTFLAAFIPTCAIAAGGLWLGIHRSGFWYGLGWIIAVVFGVAALLETSALINGFVQVRRRAHDARQKLQDLEERDAALFAQGKSFDEISARYNKPKS